MFDGITKAIEKVTAIPLNIYEFFTDPIWAVIGIALLVIAGSVVLRIFFPAQAPIWGAIAVAAMVYVYAFLKGQQSRDAALEKLRAEIARLKQPTQNDQGSWWGGR